MHKTVLACAALAACATAPPQPPATPPTPRLADVIQECLPAAADIQGITKGADGNLVGYAGSAVLIHADGYLVTNAHVVGGIQIQAHLDDGRVLPCRVVARHPTEDLAILKIDGAGPLRPLAVGRNDQLRVGDPVFVVGNPNGLTHTVTTGIVSRLPKGYIDNGHIQTSAAINGGNSGGPLINERGELVGIVCAKIGGEGLGLAIPVDRLRHVFSAMTLDEMTSGWSLGLEIDTMSAAATVLRVATDGVAAAAGIQIGDVVRQVDQAAIRSGLDFCLAAADRPRERTLALGLERAGKTWTAQLTPREVPSQPAVTVGETEPGLHVDLFAGSWDHLPDFAALPPTRTAQAPTITPLLPDGPKDDYGLRYAGLLQVPTDGAYVFTVTSDDGSRLWLGDTLVVDNDGLHAPQAVTGIVRLRQGHHPFRLEFFERNGGEVLTVQIEGPGLPKQDLGAAMLMTAK